MEPLATGCGRSCRGGRLRTGQDEVVPTFSENCWVSLGLEIGGWCGVTVLCPLRMPVSICMKAFYLSPSSSFNAFMGDVDACFDDNVPLPVSDFLPTFDSVYHRENTSACCQERVEQISHTDFRTTSPVQSCNKKTAMTTAGQHAILHAPPYYSVPRKKNFLSPSQTPRQGPRGPPAIRAIVVLPVPALSLASSRDLSVVFFFIPNPN